MFIKITLLLKFQLLPEDILFLKFCCKENAEFEKYYVQF